MDSQYGGQHQSGVIYMNTNSSAFDSGNFYHFQSLIQHERIHLNTRSMSGNFQCQNFREYVAYNEQINHSTFKYLPEDVQNTMRDNLNFYRRKAQEEDHITDFNYSLPLGVRG